MNLRLRGRSASGGAAQPAHRTASVAEVDPAQHVRPPPGRAAPPSRSPPAGRPASAARTSRATAPRCRANAYRETPRPRSRWPSSAVSGGHVEQQQVQAAAAAPRVPGEPAAHPRQRAAVVHDDAVAGAQRAAQPGVVGERGPAGGRAAYGQQARHPARPSAPGCPASRCAGARRHRAAHQGALAAAGQPGDHEHVARARSAGRAGCARARSRRSRTTGAGSVPHVCPDGRGPRCSGSAPCATVVRVRRVLLHRDRPPPVGRAALPAECQEKVMRIKPSAAVSDRHAGTDRAPLLGRSACDDVPANCIPAA